MTSPLHYSDVLGQGGILSRRLEGWRERPQQLALADAISEAVTENQVLLAEAPTGVGKSFAYLVPAILDVVSQGKKVVIATHTIALQDQLLNKDLPVLGACLPIEFLATKAMGRSNYLGLRRLGLALDRVPDLVPDDPAVMAMRRISNWSAETSEGRRQELNPLPSAAVWEEVQSESDNCLGRRCSHYEDCHYQKARRRLHTADIIVTNHALYCIDLMLRKEDQGILPDHHVLVVDEAHHLERVAAEHFGVEISKRQLQWFLRRLRGAGKGPRGLLGRLTDPGVFEAEATAETLQKSSAKFFASVESWLNDNPSGNGRYRQGGLFTDLLSSPLERLSELLEASSELCDREEIQVEVAAFSRRARALAQAVRVLIDVDDPRLVYFATREPGRGDTSLAARPLDVASILKQDLYPKVPSVIFTSATLAAGKDPKDLRYTAERLGVESPKSVVLDSPFDFERQVEAFVPAALPAPDHPRHEAAAAEAALEAIQRCGGGAFVLCTSYRSLEGLHRRLSASLQRQGLLVLRQGDSMDRATMLQKFKEDGNAVLFGTESFWHGVDVPGPALRCVIIARLPFPVPSLPLNEARSEEIKRKGGSPFSHFMMPEALIRFRQGVGRLIRSEEDEGILVCLDPRLHEKSYGKRFREAVQGLGWQAPRSAEQDRPYSAS